MAHVVLKDVSFNYPNGFLAVDGVNIDIESGKSLAIIGQNGAGKTTMVKMINGLLKPSSGDVFVGDINTKDYTTAQVSRKVGYVFQNPDDQIFHATVIDEVAFGPDKMGIEEKRKKRLINYALKWTGLYEHRNENPYNLPLSIRKFITIAAIIAMDVDVMIFDEPTAGQDLNGLVLLSKILKELKRRGKTLVTITHDMQFVVENFDHVIVMANKKVVKVGSPKQIFWEFEVLEEAMLKQPYISSLSKRLELGEGITTKEELVDAVMKRIK
jgi:energy-coupling factor transport system ATP-binding protein